MESINGLKPNHAPMIKTAPHCVKCTGCNNVIHTLDVDTAICPFCIAQELTQTR